MAIAEIDADDCIVHAAPVRRAPKKKRKHPSGAKKVRGLAYYRDADAIPTDLLTASQFEVAAQLTIHEFKSLCKSGHIKPKGVNPQKHRLYPRDLVHKIALMKDAVTGRIPIKRWGYKPEAYGDADAHRVISRLAEGATLEEIHLETKIHPQKLLLIAKDRAELARSLVLTRKAIDEIETLPIAGAIFPLRSGDDVVAILRLALKEHLCASCKRARRSTQCAACLKSTLARAARASAFEEDDQAAAKIES